MMIATHRAEMSGRVKMSVSGGSRAPFETGWFDNMVLDQGLRFILSAGQPRYSDEYPMGQVSVGASSQAVSKTDAGLIQPVARQSVNQPAAASWDAGTQQGVSTKSFTFGRGVAAGNISELGLGPIDATNSRLVARTLVKDASGQPTTITVLEDEVLTVTWQLRRTWLDAQPHTINYDDGDGGSASTLVTYKTTSQISKDASGLGRGEVMFGGSLVSDFTARKSLKYTEAQGNPQISVWNGDFTGWTFGGFPSESGYATFDPPIPKTNEFILEMFAELTLTRAGE